MQLHPSWWRAVLADSALIPVPLSPEGLPDLDSHQIPEQGTDDMWLLIAPANSHLCPDFVEVLRGHAMRRPEVGIFYADEVETLNGGTRKQQLKPAMNLLLQLADDYVGSPVMVLHSVFNLLGGFRHDAHSAVIYDFILRAAHAGISIERIPKVMVAHAGRRPRALVQDRRGAVVDWIDATGKPLDLDSGLTAATLQLRRHFSSYPSVTVVIATRQARARQLPEGQAGAPHIINLLDGLSHIDWPMQSIKVLIGDDIPDDSIYSGRIFPFDIRRIDTRRSSDAPFSYAAKMNSLWRQAITDYIVFINDDVLVRDAGWLRALMTFAMEDDVGGVGARLLFGDGRLQHAGIAGGLCGSCVHAWIFAPAHERTYNDWALVHREWSMVTGAVFATRREVLEQVNGFDERFSLEYNDVDLCLRMRLHGYKIVYTPFAEMIHYERASRGGALPRADQVAMFLKRWEEVLKSDPAFNPGFDMSNVYVDPAHMRQVWFK